MREERLVNEELARALIEYLKTENNEELLYKNIENLYREKYKIDNLKEDSYIINNYYNDKYNKYEIYKEGYEPDRGINPIRNDRTPSSTIQETKEAFLQNPSSILNGYSSIFLREDEEVILASIRRDINSIKYSLKFNETIIKTVVEEAKRQNYTFDLDTPLFIKSNIELIKISIQNDINTINLVPNSAWTSELIDFALSLVLTTKYVIEIGSLDFLKKNFDVIKQSIKLNPQSFDLVKYRNLNQEQINELIDIIINSKLDYVLNSSSPLFLSRNIKICLKSINSNLSSVEHISFNYLKDEDIKSIVDLLIEKKYVLNNKTSDKLKNVIDLCLSSIKIDINSVKYFPEELIYWLHHNLDDLKIKNEIDEDKKNIIREIKHYLVEHDYYSTEEFTKFTSAELNDEVVLNHYLKIMGISKESPSEESKKYYERVKHFISSALNTPLEISNIKKIFQIVSLKKWEEYRRENNDYYTNIFNRICDSLEQKKNFIEAMNELRFLIKVDDVLDEKKYALFNAFIEYHQIFHNPHIDNKIELLQSKRDQISEYAALFISKSKEEFISEKVKEYEKIFKIFFIIKIDNPVVKKKVVEVKQRDMLRQLYNEKDEDLIKKLEIIKNKYLEYNFHSSLDKDKLPEILELFISKLINNNQTNIDEILSDFKPKRFDEYEIYEKVSKLINRLNNHNISYDGAEVDKYRHLITYDGQKYIYNGDKFNGNEIARIMVYKDFKYIYGKIRSEIIKIAKNIDEFDSLTQDDIKIVIDECPFSDEYYTFNSNVFNRYYMKIFNAYISRFEDNKELILNDIYYQNICKLIVNDGLFQANLISLLGEYDVKDKHYKEISNYISDENLWDTVENFPNLVNLLSTDELTIDNLDNILEFKEMFKYAELGQISLLGKDVIKKIYSNNGFISASQSERIDVACDLVSAMVSRDKSTVPYINGTNGRYKYSMYDSTDTTLLTAGLDTNACFRCCGNDNDFLHYCALDKNGFVIKLTDLEGNFIGRASGFRNGNGIYINQLRTIYDKKSSAYGSEKDAIIITFEKACSDMVELSQNNPDEENKIDFVVVTKSYTLSDTNSNVNQQTFDTIGFIPMENQSEDWKKFVFSTKNLRESITSGRFTTDFGGYPLICIKSAIGELTPEKIKRGDVEALYSRNRKQITIDDPSEVIEKQINKVRAIYCHQNNSKFSYLKISQNYKIINGDNWYIILGEEGILDSCYIANDKFAEREFNSIMEQITNNQQIFVDLHNTRNRR